MSSPRTIAWQKFRRHIPGMIGSIYLLIWVLIALFAYPLSPDATSNANQQALELAKLPPGSSGFLLNIPRKGIEENDGFWWFKGKEQTYNPIALQDFKNLSLSSTHIRFIRKNGVVDSVELSNWNSEGFSLEQAMENGWFEEKTYRLGTDTYGRDLLSRILLGGRISLAVGMLAVLISLGIGIIVGAMAGYFGNNLRIGRLRIPLDNILMWFVSVMWSIPTLLLALAISFVLGRGFWQLFLAIGLSIWVEVARLVRGQIISARENLYVEAGEALGFGNARIMFRHILPNIVSPIIVIAVANFGAAVLIESGLSFLGLGVEVPVPTWGQMIYEGYTYIVFDYGQWLALYPGLALVGLIISINLIGIGLRDALDLRLGSGDDSEETEEEVPLEVQDVLLMPNPENETSIPFSENPDFSAPKGENVYQTDDPAKLLQLKRLEADAILDVLRSINNADMTIPNLCLVVRNLLWAQLAVRKMAFYYQAKAVWHEGMRLKFEEFSEEALDEMFGAKKVSQVSQDEHPHLHGMGVEYIIPISNRGESNGYFVIADFADSPLEVENDLIFVETMGNILAVAIRNRELFEERMAKESLQKELEVASSIQNQLLITDFNRFKPLDIYGYNEAHHGVGGDFYDVIKKGNDSYYVCIADVSGKGIGAALLMANLQANLRSLCAQYDDLSIIISELNKNLFGITVGEKFVTLFLARVDIDKSTFSFVNAGHNYPILKSADGFSRLNKGCILLGILPEVVPEVTENSFEKGSILFMFTDGVVEQTDKQGEMFGSDRIVDLVKDFQLLSSQKLVGKIKSELSHFSQSVEVGDDVTMLCVKF
ncbi:MAG: SpoIIE family protein phosphatase [Bacteroidota bacterium]